MLADQLAAVLVDPDGIVAGRGLGIVAADVGSLVNGIRELIRDPVRWAIASANARRYYVENHTVDTALGRFERLFEEEAGRLTSGERSRSPRWR